MTPSSNHKVAGIFPTIIDDVHMILPQKKLHFSGDFRSFLVGSVDGHLLPGLPGATGPLAKRLEPTLLPRGRCGFSGGDSHGGIAMPPWGYPHSDGWFHGKSHRSKWMMTRGSPMTSETPIFKKHVENRSSRTNGFSTWKPLDFLVN